VIPARWGWVPSPAPKTLSRGQRVLRDWRELDEGDMVWWYSDGSRIGPVRQVMWVDADEALLGDPEEIGKPDYRGQKVSRPEHSDPTRGHALIPDV
jgi:hypothetical protein